MNRRFTQLMRFGTKDMRDMRDKRKSGKVNLQREFQD
jgi:hypothetical protein